MPDITTNHAITYTTTTTTTTTTTNNSGLFNTSTGWLFPVKFHKIKNYIIYN